MALKNVKSSLQGISKYLQSSNASREFLIKNTRDAVILCSHSIIATHKGDLILAKQKIKKAELVLKINQKKVALFQAIPYNLILNQSKRRVK